MRDNRPGTAGRRKTVAQHASWAAGIPPLKKVGAAEKKARKLGGGDPLKGAVKIAAARKPVPNAYASSRRKVAKGGGLLGRVANTVDKAIKNAKPSAPSKPKAKNKGGGGSKIGGQNIPGLGGTNIGSPLDPAMADAGAQLFNPNLADTMANAEFDPQIQVLHNQQGQQHADAAQAMADIQNWYGQVLDSQGKAATRNADAGTRATHDAGTAAAAILSSLGGGGGMGGAAIAGQGTNEADTQAALAQSENQYQNDLTPLLKLEQSGASAHENARQSTLAHDLANQLLQAVGQKGAKRTETLMQLHGMNNDILNHRLDSLLHIKEYNNNLGQQQFQNKLSARETALAAAMTGAQINAYNQSSGSGSKFTPWTRLDPSQRNDLVNAAVGNSLDQYGGLTGDPTNAWNVARQYLTGQGYTSAAKGVHNKAHTQIGSMIDAALQHAIAMNRRRAQLAQQ